MSFIHLNYISMKLEIKLHTDITTNKTVSTPPRVQEGAKEKGTEAPWAVRGRVSEQVKLETLTDEQE